MKIVLLTGIHLCHNPRVIKEARALARAGHDVHVLGGWIDPALKRRDIEMMRSLPFAYTALLDMTQTSFIRTAARVRNKISRLAAQSGREWRTQLGYAYPALRAGAFRHEADLYIAHSEAAMAVAADLLHTGRRVGVDLEDWFSEDMPPDAPSLKPLTLLRGLERELLSHGSFAVCPSHAMSVALADAHACRLPTVVYNAFEWSERHSIDGERKDRRDATVRSLHWVSQTIGKGRGLEDLFSALQWVRYDFEIHLRGNISAPDRAWLVSRVPERWRDRLFIHPLVENDELTSRIAEHDIGFAGEMTHCQSRQLTVTNKILHYLLAGLAVVATDTPGQREVAEQADAAVTLYPVGDAKTLADRLNALLGAPSLLAEAKARALEAAHHTFCWERQEPTLLRAAHMALGN